MQTGSTLLDTAKSALIQSYWNKANAAEAELPALKETTKKHWSYYLLGLGALASVVATIAGVILTNFGLIIGGIFYTLTMGIGAYYISRFGSEQVFEQYIEIFTLRVQQITKDILLLSQENTSLKNNVSDLTSEITRSQNLLDEKEKKLQQASDELAKNTQNLQNKANTAEEFVRSIDQYQKENQRLQTELSALSVEAKNLNTSKLQLEEEMKELVIQGRKMTQELDEYTTHNKAYEDENKILKALIHDLQLQMKNPLTLLPKTPSTPTKNQDESEKPLDNILNNVENSETQLDSKIDTLENINALLQKIKTTTIKT
jgi:chromosome segregation ATPase